MPSHARKLCIFIVDDEAAIVENLAQALAQEGYETRCFANALDALEAASETAVHLLMTEMVLPGLSGVQLAIRMREIAPHCRFLFFSGEVSTDDYFSKGYSGPRVKIHQKPLRIPELMAEILALNLGEGHINGIYRD